MANPYITNLDPYIFAQTTQGTGLQDQFNAQALQQMGQLASQAGQPAQGYKSASPLSLADALRKMQPTSNTDFLNTGYTAPSVGINPYSQGFGIDPYSLGSFGLK